MTWTIQDVFSKAEKPARKGLFSSDPAREEFHIETDDLEAARMGVSSYERHALVPHEAYQALYAAGETKKIFDGYKVHVLSNGQVSAMCENPLGWAANGVPLRFRCSWTMSTPLRFSEHHFRSIRMNFDTSLQRVRKKWTQV